MNNLITEILKLSPHVATAIIACISYIFMRGFKVPKRWSVPIATIGATILALMMNGLIDILGVELLSAFAGVSISGLLIKRLRLLNDIKDDMTDDERDEELR